MSVWKCKNRGWLFAFMMKYPDGTKEWVKPERSPVQTKRGAEEAERQRYDYLLEVWRRRTYGLDRLDKAVPTLNDWFTGRFWEERVVGKKRSPSYQAALHGAYRMHIKDRLGGLTLKQIVEDGHIPGFRAYLVRLGLGDKRINNVLGTLSVALKYARDQRLIDFVPGIGMTKIEPNEILWWDCDEYRRLLEAAYDEGPAWFLAVLLCGEAGLRIGEVRALVGERDLDLVGGTVTVQFQSWMGKVGPPKGKKRRKVPMTGPLLEAIGPERPTGPVVCLKPGVPVTDSETSKVIYSILERAKLPKPPRQAWHALRHTYATHAAQFGVNPWRLMTWMGHKALTQTIAYVNLASDHPRPIPDRVASAGKLAADDADRRIVAMLGARARGMRKGAAKVLALVRDEEG